MHCISWKQNILFIVVLMECFTCISCSKQDSERPQYYKESSKRVFQETSYAKCRAAKNESQEISKIISPIEYRTGHSSPNNISFRSTSSTIVIIMLTCLAFSLAWLVILLADGCSNNFIWPTREISLLKLHASKRAVITSALIFSTGTMLVGCGAIIVSVKQLKDSHVRTTHSVRSALKELPTFKNLFEKSVKRATRTFESKIAAAAETVCKDTAVAITEKSTASVMNNYLPVSKGLENTFKALEMLQNFSLAFENSEAELRALMKIVDQNVFEFHRDVESLVKSKQLNSEQLEIGRHILSLKYPIYETPKESVTEIAKGMSSFAQNGLQDVKSIREVISKAMNFTPSRSNPVDMVFAMRMIKPKLVRQQSNKAHGFREAWSQYFGNLTTREKEVMEWQEKNDYYYGVMMFLVISLMMSAFPLIFLFGVGTCLGTMGTKCFMYCSPQGFKTGGLSDRGSKIILNSIYLASCLLWIFWALVLVSFVMSNSAMDACEAYDPMQLLIYRRSWESGNHSGSIPKPGRLKIIQPCKRYQDFVENIGWPDVFTINRTTIKNVLENAVKVYTKATISSFADQYKARFFTMDWLSKISAMVNASKEVDRSFEPFRSSIAACRRHVTEYDWPLIQLFVHDLNKTLDEKDNSSVSDLQAHFGNLKESMKQVDPVLSEFSKSISDYRKILITLRDFEKAAKSWEMFLTSGIDTELKAVVNLELDNCSNMYYQYVDEPFYLVRNNRSGCKHLSKASLKISTFTCRVYFSPLMSAWLGLCLVTTFSFFAVIFGVAAQFMFQILRERPEDMLSLAQYEMM